MPAPIWKEQGKSEKPWKVNFCINAQYLPSSQAYKILPYENSVTETTFLNFQPSLTAATHYLGIHSSLPSHSSLC